MNSTEVKPQADPPSSNTSRVDDDLVVRAVQEYLALVEAGKRPDRLAFAARYPEIADALAECLAGLDFVQAAVPELSDPGAERVGAPVDGEATPAVGMLGEFRIIREIGRGGMGIVYEAEQLSLGRRVALKVLPFAATLDAKQLQRFKNEAQAAAHLQHQNIVPVHSVGCERGVHFYAMQFIEGQSLAQVISDLRLQILDLPRKDRAKVPAPSVAGAEVLRSPGPPANSQADVLRTPGPPANAGASEYLSPGHESSANLKSTIYNLKSSTIRGADHFRALVRLGIQAAEALEHAHQLGVVHRDIKPANLLVDVRGNLWIADFGLAQFQTVTPLTLTGDLVGTLRYMSPEQTQAKRLPMDHRTDIYSLGATLYELLTLEPAFPGEYRHELLRQIAQDEPRPPRRLNKSIPAELEIIVGKAMAKDSADRYATAQELADDLERFTKDEPIRARRPSLGRRLRSWSRRHKALVSGAAVLVFTVMLLGGIALWQQERQSAATAHAVANDLNEAEFWQGKEDWPKTLQALERASGQLRGSGLESLQDRVEKRRREVALVARLEDAQLKASGSFDYAAADKAYQGAFAELGLDVAALAAEEIARQIQASSIRTQLIMALDNWATYKDEFRVGDGEALRAIARLCDDDPWRKKLRDQQESKERTALEHLAEEHAVLDQPPHNLLLLSIFLERVKAREAGIRLLRQAQERYPADFWINVELAFRLDLEPGPSAKAEAVGFYRAALARQPHSSVVYNNLGHALYEQHKLPEAVAAYRKAIELQPDFAAPYSNLGNALRKQQKLPEAVAAYRKAIDIKPDYADAYRNLGHALHDQHKLPEAVAAYRKAIDIKPDYADAHYNLGNVLYAQQKLPEAAAAHRKAIKHKPNFAMAYNNLGIALRDQHILPEAVAAYRKVIELQPDFAMAYNNLGVALRDQQKLPEAVAAHRKAIELKPDYAEAFSNLGTDLHDQQKLPEAVAAYRKAIDLQPDLAPVYSNLGLGLSHLHELPAAVAAYRKAIDLNPALAMVYADLGHALYEQQMFREAIGQFRKAIDLKPDFVAAYFNLGITFLEEGQFADSLASLKKGRELASRVPNGPPFAEWVRRAEQYMRLNADLPGILSGEKVPASAAEYLDLAKLCKLQYRQLHATGARFYQEAFAAEPKLMEDRGIFARYYAAGAAALAGCGQGKDAANLDTEEYARLRGQSLAWLRAELAVSRAELEKNPEKMRPEIRKRMEIWQQDRDLDGVRGAAALAGLREAERQEWRKLWEEVEDLAKRAGKPK